MKIIKWWKWLRIKKIQELKKIEYTRQNKLSELKISDVYIHRLAKVFHGSSSQLNVNLLSYESFI